MNLHIHAKETWKVGFCLIAFVAMQSGRTVIDMRLLHGIIAGTLWVMLMIYAIARVGVEIPENVQWLSTAIIVAGAMAGGD